MAYSSLLFLSFCFLVFFHGCFARIDLLTNRGHNQRQQQQQSFQQQRSQTQCQLQNLNALEPQHRYKSEAGVTEFWDQNEQQFQCAGVALLRHKIQRRGLLLPSFNNAPQLFFVAEGQGIHGMALPGCPETFQSQSQAQQQSRNLPDNQQNSQDQRQKIRRIKEGDVVVMPAGVPHWIYNNGESQLVLVSLVDVGNNANQLDQNFRKFFVAGNPQEELVRGGQSQRQSRDRSQSQGRSRGGQEEERQESGGGNNILSGFSEKLLAEAFGIDTRLARKLQGENDNRGAIVKTKHEFELTSPEEIEEEQRQRQQEQGSEEEEEEEEEEEQEQEQQRRRHRRRGGENGSSNGLEETFCTMTLKHQTDSSYADVFNPRAGRITTVNSFDLPVLQFLQLSAERGVLYKNAIYAPHWNFNAHSIVYVTRGNGRIQIVAENGEAIFDDQVEEGQVITVPQNHAVVKQAGNQGFEWIAFKTNANAKISQIAGRASVFRGLPVDVLANSFDISREEAIRLKQSRKEVSLFSPRQGSQSQSQSEQ